MARRVVDDAVEGETGAVEERYDESSGQKVSQSLPLPAIARSDADVGATVSPANPFPDFDPAEVIRTLRSFRDGDPDEQTETWLALRDGLNERRLPGHEIFP